MMTTKKQLAIAIKGINKKVERLREENVSLRHRIDTFYDLAASNEKLQMLYDYLGLEIKYRPAKKKIVKTKKGKK